VRRAISRSERWGEDWSSFLAAARCSLQSPGTQLLPILLVESADSEHLVYLLGNLRTSQRKTSS